MSVISYVYHSVPWYMYTYTYMVYFSILSKLLHVYGCVKTMRLALVGYAVSELGLGCTFFTQPKNVSGKQTFPLTHNFFFYFFSEKKTKKNCV